MWRTWWEWLTGHGRRASHVEASPRLAGVRDERRLEAELFEAQTRFAGSRADVPPPAPQDSPRAGRAPERQRGPCSGALPASRFRNLNAGTDERAQQRPP